MRKHIRSISKRAKLGKSKPTLKSKSKLGVKPKKTHGNTSKPTTKNGGVKNGTKTSGSGSSRNTPGKNGPRMTTAKRIAQWEKREPKKRDFKIGRNYSEVRYQQAMKDWQASKPK